MHNNIISTPSTRIKLDTHHIIMFSDVIYLTIDISYSIMKAAFLGRCSTHLHRLRGWLGAAVCH